MFSRYFYALDIDKSIEAVSASGHHCCALKAVPTHIHQQSTSDPPTHVSTSFAADVMRRYRQFVLVLRETVTSYTVTTLIDNERHDQLRASFINAVRGNTIARRRWCYYLIRPHPRSTSLEARRHSQATQLLSDSVKKKTSSRTRLLRMPLRSWISNYYMFAQRADPFQRSH